MVCLKVISPMRSSSLFCEDVTGENIGSYSKQLHSTCLQLCLLTGEFCPIRPSVLYSSCSLPPLGWQHMHFLHEARCKGEVSAFITAIVLLPPQSQKTQQVLVSKVMGENGSCKLLLASISKTPTI